MTSPSSAQFVPKILQRSSDAPIAAQGRADPACRPDRRSHAGDASSGWTAPSIFQGVSFRQGQAAALGTRPGTHWQERSCAARPPARLKTKMDKCPVCKSDAEELEAGLFDGYAIRCPTHGEIE